MDFSSLLTGEALNTILQVAATAGVTVAGIKGSIAALTSRVDAIEVQVRGLVLDVAELRARYTRQHPEGSTAP